MFLLLRVGKEEKTSYSPLSAKKEGEYRLILAVLKGYKPHVSVTKIKEAVFSLTSARNEIYSHLKSVGDAILSSVSAVNTHKFVIVPLQHSKGII